MNQATRTTVFYTPLVLSPYLFGASRNLFALHSHLLWTILDHLPEQFHLFTHFSSSPHIPFILPLVVVLLYPFLFFFCLFFSPVRFPCGQHFANPFCSPSKNVLYTLYVVLPFLLLLPLLLLLLLVFLSFCPSLSSHPSSSSSTFATHLISKGSDCL